MPSTTEIVSASVKVMRSHDYCHFEICLSSDSVMTSEAVDALRKTAARLADKAVEQYKAAKQNAELAAQDQYKIEDLRRRRRRILETPESEHTPEDKAILKALEDFEHFARRRYDYSDDWQEQDSLEVDDGDAVF